MAETVNNARWVVENIHGLSPILTEGGEIAYDWGGWQKAGGATHNDAALDVLASMGWVDFMTPLPFILKNDMGHVTIQTEFDGWIYGANADSIDEAVKKIMEADHREKHTSTD